MAQAVDALPEDLVFLLQEKVGVVKLALFFIKRGHGEIIFLGIPFVLEE